MSDMLPIIEATSTTAKEREDLVNLPSEMGEPT